MGKAQKLVEASYCLGARPIEEAGPPIMVQTQSAVRSRMAGAGSLVLNLQLQQQKTLVTHYKYISIHKMSGLDLYMG